VPRCREPRPPRRSHDAQADEPGLAPSPIRAFYHGRPNLENRRPEGGRKTRGTNGQNQLFPLDDNRGRRSSLGAGRTAAAGRSRDKSARRGSGVSAALNAADGRFDGKFTTFVTHVQDQSDGSVWAQGREVQRRDSAPNRVTPGRARARPPSIRADFCAENPTRYNTEQKITVTREQYFGPAQPDGRTCPDTPCQDPLMIRARLRSADRRHLGEINHAGQNGQGFRSPRLPRREHRQPTPAGLERLARHGWQGSNRAAAAVGDRQADEPAASPLSKTPPDRKRQIEYPIRRGDVSAPPNLSSQRAPNNTDDETDVVTVPTDGADSVFSSRAILDRDPTLKGPHQRRPYFPFLLPLPSAAASRFRSRAEPGKHARRNRSRHASTTTPARVPSSCAFAQNRFERFSGRVKKWELLRDPSGQTDAPGAAQPWDHLNPSSLGGS